MALIFNDRVKEISSTAGTGTLTLLGAPAGYQTASAGIGNGNTGYFGMVAVDSLGVPTGDWEVSLCTVGAGTLSRDTVSHSSNSGNKVNFSGGTIEVFNTIPAAYLSILPYVNNATNSTLTRSGSGPYTLGLNTANSNAWTRQQYYAQQTLTQSGGNISWSWNAGRDFITSGLSASTTYSLQTPSTLNIGDAAIVVPQPSGGGTLLSFGSYSGAKEGASLAGLTGPSNGFVVYYFYYDGTRTYIEGRQYS